MTPLAIAGVLAALVATATVFGLLWQAQNGRVRTSTGDILISGADVAAHLGANATLLQFSSQVCAPCVATHRVLGEVAAGAEGIAHVELDIVAHPALVTRFNILQTPTTLILDERGAVRARIGGAVKRETVNAELDRILTAA